MIPRRAQRDAGEVAKSCERCGAPIGPHATRFCSQPCAAAATGARNIKPDRIEKRIARDPSGCWLWTGRIDIGGYGLAWVNDGSRRGVNRKAHRVVWELHRGPIPPGLTLDHLCRVRRCCNPDHLEVTTQQVNILRGEGVAAMNAAKGMCPNGHPYSGANLAVWGDRRYCRTCQRAKVKRLRAKRGANA